MAVLPVGKSSGVLIAVGTGDVFLGIGPDTVK